VIFIINYLVNNKHENFLKQLSDLESIVTDISLNEPVQGRYNHSDYLNDNNDHNIEDNLNVSIQAVEKKFGNKLKLIDTHLKNIDDAAKKSEFDVTSLKEIQKKILKYIESEGEKKHNDGNENNIPESKKNNEKGVVVKTDESMNYTDKKFNE